MSDLLNKSLLESVGKFFSTFFDAGYEGLWILFFIIFLIQFSLSFLLYKSNKESALKIMNLESLLDESRDKVLSVKKRTDVVTYHDVINHFKSGKQAVQIAQEVNVSLKELEALERILKKIG